MVASTILNPCDVVKIRLQAQPLPPTHPDALYKSTFQSFKKIISEEGLFTLRTNSGLW